MFVSMRSPSEGSRRVPFLPAKSSARAALSQRADRLVDPSLPGLFSLGSLDRQHVPLLLAVGQPVEGPLGGRIPLERFAKSVGTVTSRGAVSSSMSTSTSSPPTTPALARFSALTPTMNAPPMDSTVLRYVCPRIVTRTAGRLPAPRPATTSSGTRMPVAVLRSARWWRGISRDPSLVTRSSG